MCYLDNAETIVVEGGYEDRRFLHFSVHHFEPRPEQEEDSSSFLLTKDNATTSRRNILDAAFAFKLNHSRLLSGHFDWRKEIEKEIKVSFIDDSFCLK